MRQPLKGEAACVMGANCECQFLDPKLRFTAVEVRLPQDPPQAQMCVLCSRKTTQKLFYDICFAGEPVKGVIQARSTQHASMVHLGPNPRSGMVQVTATHALMRTMRAWLRSRSPTPRVPASQ